MIRTGSRSGRLNRKRHITRNTAANKASGVALIVALLMLTLMSVLGLGMVLAASSDSLVNGYYGSYRSSYYSADAGLKIVRQQMANLIYSDLSSAMTSWSCSTVGNATASGTACGYPLANPYNTVNSAGGVMPTLLSEFGSWQPLSGPTVTGTTATSWPGNFELSSASTICPLVGGVCATSSTPAANQQACSTTTSPSTCTYQFQYTLVTVGKGPSLQQVKDTETGTFTISVNAGTQGLSPSFSQFGAFINNFQANTDPLVCGTITGPQWTNGSWNFGTCSAGYTFTDPVYQVGTTISYDFPGCGGYCYEDSAATSYKYGGQTIAPNFEQGFYVSPTSAQMPSNDFNQQWAVLNGNGTGESSAPSPTAMQALQTNSGTAYSGTPTSGVYLPVSGSITGGTAQIVGGGIYVAGNVNSITLTPGTDSANPPNLTQSYTIVQGTTTTVITTDIGANTTTISSGGTSHTVSGVPRSSTGAATLLYVAGNIGASSGSGYTGLQGPGGTSNPSAAAIQNGVQLSVVASGNIDVVGNLLYEQEPVTLNAADTLVANASSQTQVLGLYTNNGNLGLYTPYSNGNLEIDGAIALVGSNCPSTPNSCGLQTLNTINTLTIVGGRSEGNAHSVSMSTSNTYYDRRFLNGVMPPFFPSTTLGTALEPTTPKIPAYSFARVNWTTTPQN